MSDALRGPAPQPLAPPQGQGPLEPSLHALARELELYVGAGMSGGEAYVYDPEGLGEIALDGSEVFGETPAHLSRIEVEIDSSASLHAGVAEFMDEMRDGLGLRPTGLAKFELGLSAAALNPSGASILDLNGKRPAHHFTPRSPTSYV